MEKDMEKKLERMQDTMDAIEKMLIRFDVKLEWLGEKTLVKIEKDVKEALKKTTS